MKILSKTWFQDWFQILVLNNIKRVTEKIEVVCFILTSMPSSSIISHFWLLRPPHPSLIMVVMMVMMMVRWWWWWWWWWWWSPPPSSLTCDFWGHPSLMSGGYEEAWVNDGQAANRKSWKRRRIDGSREMSQTPPCNPWISSTVTTDTRGCLFHN